MKAHSILIIPTLGILVLAGCSKKAESSLPVLVNSPQMKAPSEVKSKEGAAVRSATAAPAPPEFKMPEHVRGIYLTAWSAGSTKKIDHVIEMFKRTGLNAVVIDVRDSGEMYLKMGIPLADESHATMVGITRPDQLLQKLSSAGIYPIARIACFRDNFVPKVHPELAVQIKGGKPWKDRSKHMWLDPYNKKNWEYIGKVVDFALNLGFPEVQLDYVRFPSEGKSNTQIFPSRKSYPDKKALPEDVIAAFADAMRTKVKARKRTISADIFGIISSTRKDQGIGQELEKLAAPFDWVSPMVYPSHFAKGEYGIKDPNAAPYEIVKKSLADYKRRIPGKSVRPWLQDFSLGRRYGAAEVRAQIKAAAECGYLDFLLWNAGNRYTEATFAKH